MVGTLGSARTGKIDATSSAPFGWAPLVVLFIVGLVDRVEANLLSGVLPHIIAEWRISDVAAGAIPTAAAIAGAIVAIPAGYLADRYSRTRIIAIVVFIWAIATAGSGLATGFAMFFGMRVLLAAAENIDNPASGSLLADWYPPVSRAKAYGLVRVTTYLGGVGTLIGGVLAHQLGWRQAFLIMVVPGVLTALLVWFLREPRRGELDRIVAGAPVPGPQAAVHAEPVPEAAPDTVPVHDKVPFRTQFGQILRIPTLIFVCVGLGLLTLGLAGVFYWLTTLMVRSFGVTTDVAGSLSGLITIAGTLSGTLVGAWLGRRWHGARKGGRLLAGGGGITIGSLILAVALSMDSLPALAALTLLASASMSIAIPNMTACLADVVPASARGLGFAVLQLLMAGFGAFGSLIVGIVSQYSGSLVTGMYALIPVMVVGGLLTLGARASFERDARKVLDAARAS
ncbi:MFS transporter [Nonomuraea sp. MCN248]|uniref:MFS transporter n=1 Tax=Nonomuraea corallina TaxID=2989783 RepID=A0ABT4SMV7_9ACTN|nr:MFS transporter [Nonomuraea corallina]MDA0638573.1 MFS transporter [Nonomuraea corallina]